MNKYLFSQENINIWDDTIWKNNANITNTGWYEDEQYDIFIQKVYAKGLHKFFYHTNNTENDDFRKVLVVKMAYLSDNWDGNGTPPIIGEVIVNSDAFTEYDIPEGSKYVLLMVKKLATEILKDENNHVVFINSDILTYPPQKSVAKDNFSIRYNNLEDLIKDLIVKNGKGELVTNDRYYYNTKWNADGDSLTDASTLSGGQNYVDFVTDFLNLNTNHLGVGGSGYQKRYNENMAFYQRVLEYAEDVDIITIFGSGNDSTFAQNYAGEHSGSVGIWDDSFDSWDDSSKTLFDDYAGQISYTAVINHTIDNIIKTCPNAKIGLITPTPWKDQMNNESYTPIMRKMSDAIIDVAEHRGIPYLDLYRLSQLRPDEQNFRDKWFLNSDGVHPKTEAHKKYIYPLVREFMRKLVE